MDMKHTILTQSGGRRASTVLSVGLFVVAFGALAFGQAPQYPQQYPAQAPPAGVQQPATQPRAQESAWIESTEIKNRLGVASSTFAGTSLGYLSTIEETAAARLLGGAQQDTSPQH